VTISKAGSEGFEIPEKKILKAEIQNPKAGIGAGNPLA